MNDFLNTIALLNIDFSKYQALFNAAPFLVIIIWSIYIFKKEKKLDKKEGTIQRQKSQVLETTEDEVKKILGAEEAKYKQIMDDFLQDSLQKVEDLFKKSADHNKELILKSQELIGQQTQTAIADFLANLQKKFDEEYQKIQVELGNYKQAKIASIDQDFDKKLEDLAKKVLPRSISLGDHDELLMDALEQAKKAGFKV